MPKPTDKLSEYAKDLLGLIPEDGSYVGNTFLRRKLGFADDVYWDARDELLQANLIHQGKGRGGSVARIIPTKATEPITAEGVGKNAAEVEVLPVLPTELVDDESKLYQPLKKWVTDNYGRAAQEQADYFEVKITASPSGRKRESGKWSRPDVTSVEVNTYDLLPEKNVEITSYEVKRYSDATDLSNIYEAASHSRWVHYTNLVLEDSGSKPLALTERFEQELVRFGVGLVKMKKDAGAYKFEEAIEPEFQTPLAKDSNELLKAFFEDDDKGLRKFKKEIR
jgi:hypothetical protein